MLKKLIWKNFKGVITFYPGMLVTNLYPVWLMLCESDASQITVNKDMMSSCKLAHNRYKTYLQEDQK